MLDVNTQSFDNSRRFYDKYVAQMIHDHFPEYENRIAVGLAGEGSDCFGYDDFISRDHDFGTGVCLWLTDEDMQKIGQDLTGCYNRLAELHGSNSLSQRLRERRGVMTIHDFYSNILCIDCDTDKVKLDIEKWFSLDHKCLATAVNGIVFKDELGIFSSFRNMLLKHYPDKVFRYRMAEELHRFSAALQVNYARCMCRKDTVATMLCRQQGLESAMELFFLLKKVYPPYYNGHLGVLKILIKQVSLQKIFKSLPKKGVIFKNGNPGRTIQTR